ncbi:MAG: penicillin-binding protein 2 [Patescibacteria group bacterium]|nr:penicillin-binding protein 2 [Patescibacteria group bacterium]
MWRARVLFIFFIACFFAILARLFIIQVIDPGRYTSDYLQSRRIAAERGKIYDRNGEPLAVNQTRFVLFAEPKIIEDKAELVEKIDSVLGIGQATIDARIDSSKVWVAVHRGLTMQQRDALQKLKLKGIGFDPEPRRFYPESSLSAHILGFVGKNKDGEDTGYFGIEGYYEKELVGLPGFIKSERDVFGKPIFVGTQQRVEPEDGRDLVLTIDASVQNIVKTKLVEAVENFHAAQACATVADPYTMELLAQACVPDFDPDRFYEASPEAYVNTTISSLYEPGSTFKPLIVAAAIEEKAIRPQDTMVEAGPVEIGGFTIRNWNNKYAGKLSMTNILEKSSNIGMTWIGKQLGEEQLYRYLNEYGFGHPTGIDLQGEIGGLLRPRERWHPVDYATVTFGQGIAVTQIQLVRAFSSLINGGYLMKPYVVKEIRQGDKVRVREPKVQKRLFSERTSEIMKKILESSVAKAEAKFTFPKEYKIGGKTGTAQVAVQGKYDTSKTIASFIGFAPVENPRFVALVVVREPKTSIWGSETAAPVFFDIAKDLFVYYNIVPEGLD